MEIQKQIVQSSSFQKFQKLVSAGRLTHAYLITSEDDLYNEYFCKSIAQGLVCEKIQTQPCFCCDSCKKILYGFHPDVLLFPENENKSFLVQDSKTIIENANIKPMLSNYKVFIINRIHKSTQQAQNKLLKTLEDAPQNVIFLLNTSDKNNVLQTIVSRTQEFALEPLSPLQIQEIIKWKTGSENNMAISLGEGWLSKTLNFADGTAKNDYDFLLDMLTNMKSSRLVINYASKFSNKTNFLNYLKILQDIFEKILYCHAGVEEDKKISYLTAEFSIEAVYEIMNLILTAKKQAEANVNPVLVTDNLLLKILEVKYLCNTKK